MIELVPFNANDYVNFENWIQNEKELIQFGGEIFNFPISRLQIEEYLNDQHRFPFKVIYKGQAIGHAEIYLEELEGKRTAKLCRILVGDKNLRGQGIGQSIINTLLSKAFDEMNVNHTYLNVYDWNAGAIKCYEKVGMNIVSNVFKTIKVGSEEWTAIRMSISRDEFYKTELESH